MFVNMIIWKMVLTNAWNEYITVYDINMKKCNGEPNFYPTSSHYEKMRHGGFLPTFAAWGCHELHHTIPVKVGPAATD